MKFIEPEVVRVPREEVIAKVRSDKAGYHRGENRIYISDHLNEAQAFISKKHEWHHAYICQTSSTEYLVRADLANFRLRSDHKNFTEEDAKIIYSEEVRCWDEPISLMRKYAPRWVEHFLKQKEESLKTYRDGFSKILGYEISL